MPDTDGRMVEAMPFEVEKVLYEIDGEEEPDGVAMEFRKRRRRAFGRGWLCF